MVVWQFKSKKIDESMMTFENRSIAWLAWQAGREEGTEEMSRFIQGCMS